MNPLQALHEAGQSIWLDFLRRGLIKDGGLARLIHEDGVTGVTSNPTIFAKAMVGSNDYDDAIGRIARRGTVRPLDVFYDLALDDIRMAADLFLVPDARQPRPIPVRVTGAPTHERRRSA